MGWLEGLLTGYNDSMGEIRKENARKAEQAAERESKVYGALLNSEDPEIRTMAATGLIEGTQPRRNKSGMQGWFGQMEASPIYPILMKHIGNRPQTGPQTVMPPQSSSPSAAQPTTSPTTGGPMETPQPPTPVAPPPEPPYRNIDFSGGAPPAPPSVSFGAPGDRAAEPPPRASFAPGGPGQEAQIVEPDVEGAPLRFTAPEVNVTAAMPPPPPPPQMTSAAPRSVRQPNIFPTAEDLALQAARGKALGDVQGDITGYTEMFMQADPTLTPEQAHKKAADFVVSEKVHAGRAGMVRSVSGQTLDESGNPQLAYRVFDPALRQYIDPATNQADPNFRPVASVGMGQYYEQAARESGYPRGSVVPEWDSQRVAARANELQKNATLAGGTGTALAKYQAPATVAEAQAQGRPVGSTSAEFAGTQPQSPPTVAERRNLTFYNRGATAIADITRKDDTGKTLEERIAQQGLLRQYQGDSFLPNAFQTADQQMYRAAQRAFTEARLRLESGAAINPTEYINDSRTYFVQPGDSPATVLQKQNARAQVLRGIGYDAGAAYTEYYGKPIVPPLSNQPNVPTVTPPPQPPPQTGAPQTAAPQNAPPRAVVTKNSKGQTTIVVP